MNAITDPATIARRELAEMKRKVHAELDKVCAGGEISRSMAYDMMAEALGIHRRDCHVSMFGAEQCRRALEWMTGKPG